MRLSDAIESFIKEMMTADEPEIELRRNELADYFNCAPSQINYVLQTRFSPDHGYLTESRRGGGGYIRIVRVVRSGPMQLLYLVNERIGNTLPEQDAVRIITQLAEQGLVTRSEADMMASAVSTQALAVPLQENMKDVLRARILKSMLLSIAARVQD